MARISFQCRRTVRLQLHLAPFFVVLVVLNDGHLLLIISWFSWYFCFMGANWQRCNENFALNKYWYQLFLGNFTFFKKIVHCVTWKTCQHCKYRYYNTILTGHVNIYLIFSFLPSIPLHTRIGKHLHFETLSTYILKQQYFIRVKISWFSHVLMTINKTVASCTKNNLYWQIFEKFQVCVHKICTYVYGTIDTMTTHRWPSYK